MAVSPYTADFPTSGSVNDTVTTAPQTFTHMFTLQAADSKAGLALTIAPASGAMASQMTTVCFDDVSLVRQ